MANNLYTNIIGIGPLFPIRITENEKGEKGWYPVNGDIELVHNPYITIDNDGNVIGFEKGLLGTEADVAAYEKALDEQAKQEEESQEEEESNTTTTSSTGRLKKLRELMLPKLHIIVLIILLI